MIKNDTMILIPIGNNILALTLNEFNVAIDRGKQVLGASPTTANTQRNADDILLDADGISSLTGIPASWFLESARKNTIPHIKMGKYVRFRMSDIIAATEKRPKITSNNNY